MQISRRTMLASSFAALGLAGKASAQVVLPAGTKVACRLEQTLSSSTASEGQQVQLTVTEAVRVGDTVVIPQGAPVTGRVVMSEGKRSMGRTGKLDFSIEKVRTTDGESIPLRYSPIKKEGGSKGVSTGIMTAGAVVLFWPAAPFFLLRKGKDVTINQGIVLEVFTDQDYTPRQSAPVQVASVSAAVAPVAVAAAPAGGMATVTITSNVAGAEIEVDGNFVGSTPTKRQMPPGVHQITVRAGTNSWKRSMDVQGGSEVTVNAVFTR